MKRVSSNFIEKINKEIVDFSTTLELVLKREKLNLKQEFKQDK